MSNSADALAVDGCAVRLVDAGRVGAVRAAMPADGDVVDLADVFGLLADPGRLRLLVALFGGELCVCDLAASAGLSESATSHALRIVLTGWDRADAVASVLVAALMGHAAWGLLRDAGRILLQAAPDGVDLADVRAHLADVPHVVGVHDLHAWTVTSGLPTLSAHVVVADHCFAT